MRSPQLRNIRTVLALPPRLHLLEPYQRLPLPHSSIPTRLGPFGALGSGQLLV